MIVRYALSREVEIGVATSVDLDVYSDDGTQQTITSGTVTVTLGSEVIVNADTVTGGAPATYTVAASATTGKQPSDNYLEVWSVVISGTTYTFQREGNLVRRSYYPNITDTDLTDRHSELQTFSSQLGGYQKYRDEANVEIQISLLERGRRPWLIFDRPVVRRLHLYKTFELIFNDFMSVVGDGKFERLRDMYREKFSTALANANFRYDSNESGTIDGDGNRAPSATAVFVTAGPGRRRTYSTP